MQVGYVYTSAGRHENVSQEFCFPAICPQQFVSTWKVIHLTYIESELRKKKISCKKRARPKKKHTHNRHCSRKRRVSRKSLFLRLICCFDEFHLAAASVKSVSLPPTWSRPRIEWWKSPWYINSQTSQSGTSRLQIENIVFKLEMIQVLSQQFLEHCFCIQKKIAISTWWKKRFNQKKTKVQPPCQWAPEQHCPNLNGGLVGRKVHPSKSEGESSPQSQPDAEPTLDS